MTEKKEGSGKGEGKKRKDGRGKGEDRGASPRLIVASSSEHSEREGAVGALYFLEGENEKVF